MTNKAVEEKNNQLFIIGMSSFDILKYLESRIQSFRCKRKFPKRTTSTCQSETFLLLAFFF